jgi:nucleoside-diphosphate-sugar epimerase
VNALSVVKEVRNIKTGTKSRWNDGRVEYAPHPHAQAEVWRLVCDNAKAAQLLDWRPKVSLDEGVAKTREWMAERLK